ncbi:MAG: GNAT family N-acetyltransferase, partial [Chitinophagaceae bacterium]|nr:GNAT family N-acetyltransferase [Chitinophagaceae bacterium]
MDITKFLMTERLKIRVDTKEDYEKAFATLSDVELMAHFGFPSDNYLQGQKKKVATGLCNYRTNVIFFQFMAKESNNIIGCFAFHNWYSSLSRAEMGGEIYLEEHKYKGYMSEALVPIFDYGFNVLALNRIEAIIDPANTPSICVAEKMGLRKEALLKEHFYQEGVASDS